MNRAISALSLRYEDARKGGSRDKACEDLFFERREAFERKDGTKRTDAAEKDERSSSSSNPS